MVRKAFGLIGLFAAVPATAQVAGPTTAPARPAPSVDYAIALPSAGTWRYAVIPGGSQATFGANQAAPSLTIACNRSVRRVSISRPATAVAPFLYVWSSTTSRNVPASFNPATNRITAELSASDRLLDALAFSRGRIVVGPSTGGVLVAPQWPDIARVVEDCRI